MKLCNNCLKELTQTSDTDKFCSEKCKVEMNGKAWFQFMRKATSN